MTSSGQQQRSTLLRRGDSLISFLSPTRSRGPITKLSKEVTYLSTNNLIEKSNSFDGVERKIKSLLKLINTKKVYKKLDDDTRFQLFQLFSYFNIYKKMVNYYLKKELINPDISLIFRENNFGNIIFSQFVDRMALHAIYKGFIYNWTKKPTHGTINQILDDIKNSIKYLPTKTIYILRKIHYTSIKNGFDGDKMLIIFLFFKIVAPYVVTLDIKEKPKQNGLTIFKNIQGEINRWITGDSSIAIEDKLRSISNELLIIFKSTVHNLRMSYGMDFKIVYIVIDSLIKLIDNNTLKHMEKNKLDKIKKKLTEITTCLPKKDFL